MDIDEYLESLMKTEKTSKFPLSMYYSEGTKYLKLFQYEKAFQFLNEAVERDPTNIQSLLKRSKCYIGLEEYKKAIGDANKVLKLCPNNVHAIDLKGEAQYLMGDFEGGYLTYLEGRKTSPANQILRLGAQLCQDALDNSLHPRLGVKYQKGDVVNVLKPEKHDEKFQNRLKYRESARDCFRKDAKFMEDLMADENLKSVHGFCKEAIDYIRHHEKFWCMETPLHSRKKSQATKVKEIKKPQKFETGIRICNAAKRRAEFVLKRGKADDCISEATNLLNLAESLLKEREREKMKFKCDAFHLLGLAHRQLKNVSRAFQYLLEELKIAIKFSFTWQKTKAYHQLGILYRKTGDTTGTMQCLNKIIEAMDPENFDELLPEKASPEEIRQVQEINEWVENMISEIEKPQEYENIRRCNEAKQKAEYALQKGNTTDCISEASNLLNLTSSLLSKEHKNEKMKLKCDGYHLLGLAYKQKKNFHRAFDFFVEELEITEKFDFILPQAKAYHQLGVMYHLAGNTEGTMQCLKKIIEAMSPGKVDELVPKNASAEEIRQVQEIDEWVKSMISEFKVVRQEPPEPLKELEDKSIVEDILGKITERVATEDPVQLLQYSETKDEEFIPSTIIGSKIGLSRPEEAKKTYESRRERESEGLDDKSSIEEILEDLTGRIEFEDLIQQVHSVKERYKSEEFIPSSVTNEILEELAESIVTKDSVQPIQIKEEEFVPITIISSKTDLRKTEKIKETYESRRERESEGLDHKSSIEEILEELTERIEIEDLMQQVQSIKEKYKSEEFIPSTVIIENTLEVLADSIATKEPVKPVQYSETKEEEFIPITIIGSKADLRKPGEVKETYESRRKKESKGLDYKSSIEEILEELTERIEIKDLMTQAPFIKEKYKSEEFIPSTVIIEHTLGELVDSIATKDPLQPVQYSKEKDKIEEYKIAPTVIDRKEELDKLEDIKEIHESRTVTMSKRLDDKSAVEDILKKLTERIEVEDPVQLIKSVKGKSTSEKLIPTSISDTKDKFKEIKETYDSSIERKSEGLDDKSSAEEISSSVLKALTEHVAMVDTAQHIHSVKEKSKSEEFIPTSIIYSKDKFEEIKQLSESSRETESGNLDYTSSIEDIVKKITKSIEMEDPLRWIPPAKEKRKSQVFIPTAISDEKDKSGKFKEIKETYEPSKETEGLDDNSNIEDIVKTIIKHIAMEDPIQLIQPIKEKSKSKEFSPTIISDGKDESDKLEKIKEIREPSREREPEVSKDESVVKEISEESREISNNELIIASTLKELTESIAMEYPVQPVHLVKENSKSGELVPIAIIDKKDDSCKSKEFKGTFESRADRNAGGFDDKSSIENILRKITESVAVEDPEQLVHSIKEIDKTEELIPIKIVDSEEKSGKPGEIKGSYEPCKERVSKSLDNESSIKEILEKLTERIAADDSVQPVYSVKEERQELIPSAISDSKIEIDKLEKVREIHKTGREINSKDIEGEAVIGGISKEPTLSIEAEDSIKIVQSIKEKEKIEELTPGTTIDGKDESEKLEGNKEVGVSSRQILPEDSDEESIPEEISEDITDDESIIEDTLKELTESIPSKHPIQLVQSVKEKSVTKELIPTTIIRRKKESAEFKEMKGTRESSRERESEDSEEESITEEISENLINDESIIKDTLKELTESTASKHPVQLVQPVKEKSITEEFTPTMIIGRKRESFESKEVEKTHESSTERESKDSDDESVIEEILEDLTESVAIEDVEQQVTPRLEKKFEKLGGLTKMRPTERASGLCKPVKMEKSPISTQLIEKSDDSVTRGLTEDRKESSKFEKIKKVKQSAKQAEKSVDLKTYGTSKDFEDYNISQISKPVRKQKKMVDLEADFVVEYEDTPIAWERKKDPKRSKSKSNYKEKSEKVTSSNVIEDDKGTEISREETTSDDTKTKFIKKDDGDENAYS